MSECVYVRLYDMRKIILNKGSYQMNRLMALTMALLLSCFITKAQNYPQNCFRYPLDSIQQYISLFNALRDNHFHSGLDLKTQEKEGLPVLASADGYVSRIKIQSVGYGKAIYINHPNGYTTVYGHLQSYHNKIAEYVHTFQYQNKTFEFDKLFDTPLLWVKKGDTIAYSGNSGRSTGPHLHFEIRDTKSEHPLNPLLFGFPLKDTLEPRLDYLHFYIFKDHQYLLAKSIKIEQSKINRQYGVPHFFYEDTITLPFTSFGIGFEAADFLTDTTKKYMLYQSLIEADQYDTVTKTNFGTAYSYTMNQGDFEKMRSINNFIDYKTYFREGKRIQFGFLMNGMYGIVANLPFLFGFDKNYGWLNLDTNYVVSLNTRFEQHRNIIRNKKTSDREFGNEIVCVLREPEFYNPSLIDIKFNIKFKADASYNEPEPLSCPNIITRQNNMVITEHATIQFNENSLNDTFSFCIAESPKVNNTYSPIIHVHNPDVPLMKTYLLQTRPIGYDEKVKNKLCWVKDNHSYQKSEWLGDNLQCNPIVFGDFKVVADTVKPSIEAKSFKKNKLNGTNIVFEIKDNMSGIKSYNGFIDNKWELFEYDAKNDLLCFLDNYNISKGKHNIRIVVKDNLNNVNIYKKEFIKK